MVVVFLLALFVSIVGIAFAPKEFVEKKLIYGYGLTMLIGVGSVISNLVGITVGQALITVIILAFFSFFLRLYLDSHFRFLVLKCLRIDFTLIVIISMSFSLILDLLDIDFATRNFDGYYATQDGLFLSSHSGYSSKSDSKELLPLTWSASTNDRYGVSYLLALLNFLKIGNAWGNAQFVMLFCVIGLLVSAVTFLRVLLQTNKRETILLYPILALSPAILLPIQYFMFGQVLGLTIVMTFMAIICLNLPSRKRSLLALFVASSLMVIYPAMIFPTAFFWVMTFFFDCESSRKINWKGLVSSAVIAIFFIALQLGFRAELIVMRIWAWLAGSLFSTQNDSEVLQFQTTVFGQYASKVGIPLYLGLIRYPFIYSLNLMELFFLLVLSSGLFITFYCFIRSMNNNRAKTVLVSFCFSWILMTFVAYLKGNGYVVLKFSTWTMPIVLGVVVVAVHRHFASYKSNKSTVSTSIVAITTLALFTSGLSSFDYVRHLRSWNSFSQVPLPSDYESLGRLEIDGTKKVAIISPTAEESTWMAGLIESVDQSRFLSLGATRQALGEALSRECKFSSTQVNWEEVGYVLESKKKVDVVRGLKFESSRDLGDLKLSNADALISGLVLNGGGLYPPTIMDKFNGKLLSTNALRWSSGQVCLGVFVNKNSREEVKMNFSNGPDITKELPWKISVNGKDFLSVATDDALVFRSELRSGWNLIQISQQGCAKNSANENRFWNARADDRRLCFAVTQITNQRVR